MHTRALLFRHGPLSATPAPLWRTFLVFLGPLVLTNVLQATSGTFNNLYVGQLLGVRAMASVASFFPLLMFLVSFVIGLGAGASVLTGQAWGAKDPEKVRAVAGTVLCAGLGLGVAVGLLGFALARPILQALGTPADVLGDAIAYARVMMLVLPFMFVSILASSVLRGVSDTVTPLRVLVVSSAIMVVLTPAFILGWAGLPRLGITSGAWALLIATLASLAWMAWHLRRRGHTLAPDAAFAQHLRIDRRLLAPVVRLGIPTGLFFITGSLADLALVSMVNGYGSDATAAWGAVAQVIAYVQFPAMSIAIAASILAAQAIGAGQPERVLAVTRVGLGMNIVVTGGLALLVFVLAPVLTGLFITDAAGAARAGGLLRIAVGGAVIFGLASVFSGVMRASGTVLVPTIISLGCLALLLVPVAWALSQVFGLQGIWMTYPITYAVALALQSLYFHRAWKKKPIRKLV